MKDFTPKKNHTAAKSVKRSSAVHPIWRHIEEFILMKNHSAAQSVKRSSANHSIWRQHERIHTDEKPFSCSKCEKKFSDRSAWKRHERIHTDRKLFSCSKCVNSQIAVLGFLTLRNIFSWFLKRKIKTVSKIFPFLKIFDNNGILRQSFQTFPQKSSRKNSITQAESSRFRQIHLLYLPKIGQIKKPVLRGTLENLAKRWGFF